jgi:hypothetical protein
MVRQRPDGAAWHDVVSFRPAPPCIRSARQLKDTAKEITAATRASGTVRNRVNRYEHGA